MTLLQTIPLGDPMKATAKLHDRGQSLWLDNVTRAMLDSGQLQRYIDEFSITGLTSNPSIFDKAIASGAYDDEIQHKAAEAADAEMLFFELAIEDLRRAADLFAPMHRRTAGVDGWVSLEVSPLLAHDTDRTVRAAADLHARAERENLYIKIPGNEQGLPAVEEMIFAGVPVNITLLFSAEQYLATAEAFMRGIERRIEAGLDPDVASVASVFISRRDAAVLDRVPEDLRGRLALAIGLKTYQAYRRLMDQTAGSDSRTPALACSGFCGRAPARRTPTSPTRSTWRRWPRRTRSTLSPNRRCLPSMTTAASEKRCEPMEAMRRPRWRGSNPPASISTHWPPASSPTERRSSSRRGPI